MAEMTEPFVRLRLSLPTLPRTRAVARRLGLHPNLVCGALGYLWAWAGRVARGEFVALADAGVVDEVAGLPGLAVAMEAVGWLVLSAEGATFVNLREHNLDPRLSHTPEAVRQRRARAARGRVSGEWSRVVTRDVTTRDQGVTTRDQSVTLLKKEEEQEEELNQKPPLPPPGGCDRGEATPTAVTPKPKTPRAKTHAALPDDLPAPLSSPACRAALATWLNYKRERGQAYRPTGLAALLKRLAGWGEAGVIAAVEASVANNWQGLFPPDRAAAPPARSPPPNRPGAVDREATIEALRREGVIV